MDKEIARKLVHSAALAPSSHNSQPWRFRVQGDRLEMLADRSRALPINDPNDRELLISCGCALMNLRLTALQQGVALDLQLLPDADDPDLLARLRADGNRPVATPEARLAALIQARHTDRGGYARDLPAPGLGGTLAKLVAQEGARLLPITDEGVRRQLAQLVAEGDRTLWADPRWRRELAKWMHPYVRGEGLGVPRPWVFLARAAVRWLNLGALMARRDSELLEKAPMLAMLFTEGDTSREWLQAGQALQKLLLGACEQGYQASFFNQVMQVAPIRQRLASVVGQGTPQILLRVGRPLRASEPTPRRTLDSVLGPA
ncbi:nitroreductase [Ferrimonas sediminicola]|uniref:Nitroreductase n=1 Tax=Ferrimonas sediminicola TaxID=2569538 RepID=A0A4U1BH44_9GAMM|nr:nitroreductase [Ferrimonas sediminicola]TKB50541.1 nitroreductase [Ferrimonas sediminicola]